MSALWQQSIGRSDDKRATPLAAAAKKKSGASEHSTEKAAKAALVFED